MNAAAQAAVDAIARSAALPCSTFVAIWALARRGLIPLNVLDVNSWRALAPDIFAAINIENHSDLWSGAPAMQALLGGSYEIVPSVGSVNPPPELTPGRWHFVQRWCGGSGHAYLVYANPDGTVRILQSSKTEGFRDTTDTSWYTNGCDLSVLTLPSSHLVRNILIGAGAGVAGVALLVLFLKLKGRK